MLGTSARARQRATGAYYAATCVGSVYPAALIEQVEMGFVARAAKNGIEQTRRDCLFEKRSIDFVVGLIEREGWTDVELSRDGVIALCETLDQAAELQNGLNLAKLNGIDVSKHRWIDLDLLRERFGLDGAAAALQLPGHSIYPLRLVNRAS